MAPVPEGVPLAFGPPRVMKMSVPRALPPANISRVGFAGESACGTRVFNGALLRGLQQADHGIDVERDPDVAADLLLFHQLGSIRDGE